MSSSSDKNESLSVKVGLKSILSPDFPLVREWLRGMVDHVTETSIHASRIALLHVIRVLQAKTAFDHPLNQNFYEHCYSLACFGSRKLQKPQTKPAYQAFQAYQQARGNQAPLFPYDSDLYRYQHANVGREMATNLKVMFKTTFLKRHRFWCIKKVEEACILLPDAAAQKNDSNEDKQQSAKQRVFAKQRRAEQTKIVLWLGQQTVSSEDTTVDVAALRLAADAELSSLAPSIWCAKLRDAVVDAIVQFRMLVPAEALPVRYHHLVNENRLHHYMPWMYHLLKHRIDHNAQCADQKDHWRLFALMPVRGYDRCHVQISTTDLATFAWCNREALGPQVAVLFGDATNDQQARLYVQAHTEDALWRRLFDVKKLCGGGKTFAHSMRTDGESVSMVWSKPQTAAPERESKSIVSFGETDTDQPIAVRDLRDKRVLGADPGKKTVVTVAERNLLYDVNAENKAQKPHTIKSYSGGQWLHVSGAHLARKQRAAARLATDVETPGYANWLNSMPSTKVVDEEAMLAHIKHLCQPEMFETMMRANGCDSVRKCKRRNYVRRQMGLAQMVNGLVGKPSAAQEKSIVFVMGSAKFQCTGPVTKVRKALKQHRNVDSVVDLDEFRTSMLASCCAHKPHDVVGEEQEGRDTEVRVSALEMEGVRGREKQRDGMMKACSHLYSVRVCQLCGTIWNRDVNAAINMLEVYLHAQAHGGQRKREFSRAVKRQSNKNQKKGEQQQTGEQQKKPKKSALVKRKKTTAVPQPDSKRVRNKE